MTDIHGPGERLTRKQTTSRPDNVSPDMWKHLSDAAKKKAKQRSAIEKPKLENARQLRGIFFIEPNDEEFKLTMKAARRKLEVPMPAAMPCKIPIKSSGETHRNVGERKTKYSCIVDADESTRPRLKGAGHQPHQDRITAKGTNSTTHYSLVHKFIRVPQALKNSSCKGSSGERMGQTGENSGMAADEGQKQERSDRRSKEDTRAKEERVVSKSRSAAMNLSSSIETCSSTASSPILKVRGCR